MSRVKPPETSPAQSVAPTSGIARKPGGAAGEGEEEEGEANEGEARETEGAQSYDLWDGPTPMPGDIEELVRDVWSELPPPESLPPSRVPGEGRVTPVHAAELGAFAADSEPPRGVTSGSFPVATAPAEPDAAALVAEANALKARGNWPMALMLAEQALTLAPSDIEIIELIEACQQRVMAAYQARLGDLTRPPRVTMSLDELKRLSLDPRAFFLLSLVDGFATLDEILDMAGMPQLEAMRYLCELLLVEAIAID